MPFVRTISLSDKNIVVVVSIVLLWVNLVALSPSAIAQSAVQPVLIISPEAETINLAPYTEVYEDKTHTVTFAAVVKPGFSGFVPLKGASLSAGYTKSAYWLRFTIIVPPSQLFHRLLEVDYPNLQRLDLYIQHSNGTIREKKSGTNSPFGFEALTSPSFVFRLQNVLEGRGASPDSLTCYLRVETESSMIVPLKLHTAIAFERLVILQYLFYGVLYGIMAAMACYNLFLWITVRERFYLFYVLYVFTFLISDIAIKGMGAVATQSPQMGWMKMLPISMPLSSLCAVLFTRSFLRPVEYSHLADKFLRGVAAFHVIILVLAFVLPYRVIVPVIAGMIGVVSLILLTVGIVSLRKGYYPARFFVAGWSIFLLGASLRSLATIGVTRFSWMADHIPVMGVALETILLSLALADRISLLKQQQAEVLERAVEARTLELQKSNVALEEADRFKTQILSIAAHDLKNPLAQILGFTQLAEMHLEKQEAVNTTNDLGELLHHVHYSADRMLEFVNNILDSASMELGKIQIVYDAFSLSMMLNGVYENYVFAASQKQQKIMLEQEQDIFIEGDGERIQQVFDNLVSNAVKYSPQGKTIWLRMRILEEAVQVEVQDEGPGLNEEDKRKLYGFFQRLSAQPTGGESSNGVGLAIVKKIVELHKGRIWVESEPQRGAKFVVELPCRRGEESFA
ncbi:MAG: sensor histidine kinase [Candidatus Kapabacteria bacterium]|nr:sensor histidine kinase [Candidatus Kapabacteria bacterium]